MGTWGLVRIQVDHGDPRGPSGPMGSQRDGGTLWNHGLNLAVLHPRAQHVTAPYGTIFLPPRENGCPFRDHAMHTPCFTWARSLIQIQGPPIPHYSHVVPMDPLGGWMSNKNTWRANGAVRTTMGRRPFREPRPSGTYMGAQRT